MARGAEKGDSMGLSLGGRRIRWRTVFAIGVLLLCLVPVVLVYRYLKVCAGASSAALREFPAYGGAPQHYPKSCWVSRGLPRSDVR